MPPECSSRAAGPRISLHRLCWGGILANVDCTGRCATSKRQSIRRFERLESRVLPALSTQLLALLGTNSASPTEPVNVNGTLFFAADDGIHGPELWKTSANGAVMVKDIWPGATGFINSLTNVNGTLFFTAGDATNGAELWKSNGTSDGTKMVRDINLGAGHSTPTRLTNVNGTLFFRANNGTNGVELWKSNGAAAGTTLVQDINLGATGSYPDNLTNVSGKLFFATGNKL